MSSILRASQKCYFKSLKVLTVILVICILSVGGYTLAAVLSLSPHVHTPAAQPPFSTSLSLTLAL